MTGHGVRRLGAEAERALRAAGLPLEVGVAGLVEHHRAQATQERALTGDALAPRAHANELSDLSRAIGLVEAIAFPIGGPDPGATRNVAREAYALLSSVRTALAVPAAREPEPPVSVRDIVGLVPDMTGEADSAEYVRWLRDDAAQPEPEPPTWLDSENVEPREGIATVYDWHGRYLGCIGIETWRAQLAEAERDVAAARVEDSRAEPSPSDWCACGHTRFAHAMGRCQGTRYEHVPGGTNAYPCRCRSFLAAPAAGAAEETPDGR